MMQSTVTVGSARPFTAEAVWWVTAGLLLALFAVTLALWAVDDRQLDGASAWAKPLKFQVALTVHVATLALVVSQLGAPWRGGPLLAAVALVSAISIAGEIAYIMFQASRLEASHFNLSTPFHATMYRLMAAGAVVIVGAAAMVGIVAAVDSQALFSRALRHAVVLGLVGGTVLTLIVAFTMGGRLSHHVGVEPAGAPRVPLTGWSLATGDLRVPHFLATHMIQAVPLAGLLTERVTTSAVAVATVWLFAGVWTLATLATFEQALGGRPLWPLAG